MARGRSSRWEEESPAEARPGPARRLRAAVATAAIILTVLYAAALVAGRTDGFRALLVPRLERALGFAVQVDRVSLDFRFGLTLRDVRAARLDPMRGAAFTAERIEVVWRWSDALTRGRPGIARLEIVRPAVKYNRESGGAWGPAALADAGSFVAGRLQLGVDPDPVAASRALQERLVAGRTALVVRKADLSWWRGEAMPFASAEGVTLLATPIALPGRTILHVLLSVSRAISAGGAAREQAVLETLDGEAFSHALPAPAP